MATRMTSHCTVTCVRQNDGMIHTHLYKHVMYAMRGLQGERDTKWRGCMCAAIYSE